MFKRITILLISISFVFFVSTLFIIAKSHETQCPNLQAKVPAKFLEAIADAHEMVFIDLIQKQEARASRIDRQKIKAYLLNDKSFLFGAPKLSMFIPSTKMVFINGGQTSCLLISKHAKKVQFLDSNEQVVAMIDIRDKQFIELSNIFNNYFNP